MKKWFLKRCCILAAVMTMLSGVALGQSGGATNKLPANKIQPTKPGAATTNEMQIFQGELRAGVMAIGGESTGYQLRTEQGRLELQPGSKQLEKQMTDLNGKKVVVTGSLTVRKGVEKPIRQIVTVANIKAQD